MLKSCKKQPLVVDIQVVVWGTERSEGTIKYFDFEGIAHCLKNVRVCQDTFRTKCLTILSLCDSSPKLG